mmetsp:Transcript_139860/g.243507  ORF Transcript_139860/g.243507 Transcript_139860/m.243507 type:complete len:202 (-) Transcript_139860:583-1188(-)
MTSVSSSWNSGIMSASTISISLTAYWSPHLKRSTRYITLSGGSKSTTRWAMGCSTSSRALSSTLARFMSRLPWWLTPQRVDTQDTNLRLTKNRRYSRSASPCRNGWTRTNGLAEPSNMRRSAVAKVVAADRRPATNHFSKCRRLPEWEGLVTMCSGTGWRPRTQFRQSETPRCRSLKSVQLGRCRTKVGTWGILCFSMSRI